MDSFFKHEVWKYGCIVNTHQIDSEDEENDENDPNAPFDLNLLSRPEIKNGLCADLQLNNNRILDAERVKSDRLQELVVNYHQIFTDVMLYCQQSKPTTGISHATKYSG